MSSPPQFQTHLSDCCYLASSFELSKNHLKLNIYDIYVYIMDNSYFALGDISPSLLPFIQANSLLTLHSKYIPSLSSSHPLYSYNQSYHYFLFLQELM